ncbi:MAG: hypothetical protein ACRCWR_01600 [Saezia sp.]
MQYAILKAADDYKYLIDANELHALTQGLANLNDTPPDTDADKEMPLQLVYGRYKPQPFFDFPKSEIKRHMTEAVNRWLIHLDKCNTIYLGIEAIEIIDVTLTASCGHCPTPHVTPDIAFAALVRVPESLTLGNGKSQAKTAFLQWFDVDPLTTVVNRKGLFSLILQEKRVYQPLSTDNWKQFIDYKRAVKYAQRFG